MRKKNNVLIKSIIVILLFIIFVPVPIYQINKEKLEQEKLIKFKETKILEEQKVKEEQERLDKIEEEKTEQETTLKEEQQELDEIEEEKIVKEEKKTSARPEKTKKLIKNKIIISVGNKIITNYDLATEIKYLNVISREKFKNLSNEEAEEIATQSLIKDKIKASELTHYGSITISEERVTQQINETSRNLGFNNVEELNSFLIKEDYNLKNLRKKIILEFKWNQLIYQLYKSQILINKEALDKKLKTLILKRKSEEFLISEILLASDTKEELSKKYTDVVESIKKDGFENTAIKFSASASSQQGGTLGWINESEISTNLLKNIKNTEIGIVSNPIMISGGMLLIKVENKRVVENEIDLEKKMNELVEIEKNKQLNQFSLNHFSQTKNNTIIKFF